MFTSSLTSCHMLNNNWCCRTNNGNSRRARPIRQQREYYQLDLSRPICTRTATDDGLESQQDCKCSEMPLKIELDCNTTLLLNRIEHAINGTSSGTLPSRRTLLAHFIAIISGNFNCSIVKNTKVFLKVLSTVDWYHCCANQLL